MSENCTVDSRKELKELSKVTDVSSALLKSVLVLQETHPLGAGEIIIKLRSELVNNSKLREFRLLWLSS